MIAMEVDNKALASTTEQYSTLRTLEETKYPSSIRIYLEAKTGINAYLRSRWYFYEETISKAGKVPFQFAATSIKPAFFEFDWPTAVEVSRTLAWLRSIQILVDRLSMQRENRSHVIVKARQFWAI